MKRIFMGHTSYQQTVFDVAKYSIERHTNDVDIKPIDRSALETLGIYTREKNCNESTEFSMTRWLTPFLAGYDGWALFCDNDVLCRTDISELFKYADPSKAVMVVKHNYTVAEGIKLDGQRQTNYPRKNWSSVVLWNCGHPSNRQITPDLVNSVSGLFLHRFMWLKDEEIGELPKDWNFLVGPQSGIYKDFQNAKMVHFTDGGPYFRNYQDVDFANEWLAEYKLMSGKDFTEEDLVD